MYRFTTIASLGLVILATGSAQASPRTQSGMLTAPSTQAPADIASRYVHTTPTLSAGLPTTAVRVQKARQRMMQRVPKADVVITNPTHFAVALRYAEGRMRAPRVVAKGVVQVPEGRRIFARMTVAENIAYARPNATKNEIIAAAQAACADEFIRKPVNASELSARVRSLVRLKRFTDELDSAESVILSLALTVEALFDAQEWRGQFPYWEGAVAVGEGALQVAEAVEPPLWLWSGVVGLLCAAWALLAQRAADAPEAQAR